MKKGTAKIKGAKIRAFDAYKIALSCVLYALLAYITASMPVRFNAMMDNISASIACDNKATMVREASDYLTEQARLYVMNMEERYLWGYFEEVNNTKRRENALADLEKINTDIELQENMKEAVRLSNELMNTEFYAMKLICSAKGAEEDKLPNQISRLQLSAEDIALSADAKVEKARRMMFDVNYQNSKSLIMENLNKFLSGTVEVEKRQQYISTRQVKSSFAVQRVLIILFFILDIVVFIVLIKLVANPLESHIRHIKNNEPLEVIGSYETKYLALAYNEVYEANAEKLAVLKERVERDPLTGILNRIAFDRQKAILKHSKLPLMLMMVDVDDFKIINDKFGHEIGDHVLKSIGNLLQKYFPEADYTIRLGGDEFVVISAEGKMQNFDYITGRFKTINNILKNPGAGLPGVSISAGVACSASGFGDDLLSKADIALYHSKSSGKGRISEYSDELKEKM